MPEHLVIFFRVIFLPLKNNTFQFIHCLNVVPIQVPHIGNGINTVKSIRNSQVEFGTRRFRFSNLSIILPLCIFFHIPWYLTPVTSFYQVTTCQIPVQSVHQNTKAFYIFNRITGWSTGRQCRCQRIKFHNNTYCSFTFRYIIKRAYFIIHTGCNTQQKHTN